MENGCNELGPFPDAAVFSHHHQVNNDNCKPNRKGILKTIFFHKFSFFNLICRREIRNAGMTLIFDARKTNPQPQLYKALMSLQVQNHKHLLHLTD